MKNLVNNRNLTVEDAIEEDAGIGFIRIDPDAARELKLERGDTIEISCNMTNKKNVALLDHERFEDKGTNLIRLDYLLRRKLEVSIGEVVQIQKVESKFASEVTFAGLEKGVKCSERSEQLARIFENHVLTKGDILSFYNYNKLFNEINRIDLIVVSYIPDTDVVRIHKETKIVLLFDEEEFRTIKRIKLLNSMKLRVKDAFKEDEGKGIVRIDPNVVKEMSLDSGDAIEISCNTTNKKTVALLDPGDPGDKGKNVIRLDLSLRRNLEVKIDDLVEIHKVESDLASEVILAGFEESVEIKGDSEQLIRTFRNHVVMKGDILNIDSFKQRIDLIVVDHFPKADAVLINENTKFVLILEEEIIKTENFNTIKKVNLYSRRFMNVKKLRVGNASTNPDTQNMRIDPDVVKELNLEIGNVIEIFNNLTGWKTVALLEPGKPEEKGTNSIILNPSLIRNLGVNIGDLVEIRKIEAKWASSVLVADFEKAFKIAFDQSKLEDRVITKGDILSFYTKWRDQKFDLIVVDYFPKADAVRIQKSLERIFSPEGTEFKFLKEIIFSEEISEKKKNLDSYRLINNKRLSVNNALNDNHERESDDFNKNIKNLKLLKNIYNIKKVIMDLGTKFGRLKLSAILEEYSIDDEYFIDDYREKFRECEVKELILDVLRKMINRKEIHAQYYSNVESITFNLQANIEEAEKSSKKWEE